MTPPLRRARHRSPSVSPTPSAIVLGGVLLFSVLSGAPAVVRAQPGDDAERMLIVGLLSEPGTLNPLVTTSSEARDIIDRFYLRLLEEVRAAIRAETFDSLREKVSAAPIR